MKLFSYIFAHGITLKIIIFIYIIAIVDLYAIQMASVMSCANIYEKLISYLKKL